LRQYYSDEDGTMSFSRSPSNQTVLYHLQIKLYCITFKSSCECKRFLSASFFNSA